MANVCSTDYVFVSKNKEQLTNFKEQMDFAMAAVQSGRVPSESGELDYDILPCMFGIVKDEPRARGYVVDILDMEHDERGYHFKVLTSDAWRAAPDVFDEILENYPEISYVYREDEPGERIAVTNDSEGIFFPERIRFRGTVNGEDFDEFLLSDTEAFALMQRAYENTENLTAGRNADVTMYDIEVVE